MKESFLFKDAFLINENKKDIAKELIEKFYKNEAKNYIFKRVERIAKRYNLKFNTVKINSAKRRWGSCSSKKSLNFSYRLIMAPKDVIDYVIIHELSHLTYMNHSKDFWNLVFQRAPNHEDCENWLRLNYLKTLVHL